MFKIPAGLAPEFAAPMLCGGITVYSPLKHWGAGPGKRVAILGVGGLGHFGVLFAKAMGADEVVGISRKAEKRAEALALGCDAYIATDDDEAWGQKWERHFDLIISTVSGHNVSTYRPILVGFIILTGFFLVAPAGIPRPSPHGGHSRASWCPREYVVLPPGLAVQAASQRGGLVCGQS